MTQKLTPTTLRERLHYAPETGVWTHLNPATPRVKKGQRAGTLNARGYRLMNVLGKQCLEHRLVWLYMFDKWPKGNLDHINGIPDDNRLANLREATQSENIQNQRVAHADNTSSYLGVCWASREKAYKAQIFKNGKQHSLGLFDDPAVAHQAYLKAKREMHPFNTL